MDGVPFTISELSRPAQDFVRSVANGGGYQVRLVASRLDPESICRLQEIPEFREVLRALRDETQWRPKPGTEFSLYGKLDPELKALRQATSRSLARARAVARFLVASQPGMAAPNRDGLHYRAAVAFSQLLKAVPGIHEVYLFGSVARGTEREESDVDVLAIRGRGMTDRRYRTILLETIEPAVEVVRYPSFRLRLRALPDAAQSPMIQIMVRPGKPNRWSDWGLPEAELVNLWQLDSADALLEARSANPQRVLAMKQGARAVLVYETYWRWGGEVPGDGFMGRALVEVYDAGELHLREVELNLMSPDWGPRAITCVIEAHGEVPAMSRQAGNILRRAIRQWVGERAGTGRFPIPFRWIEEVPGS